MPKPLSDTIKKNGYLYTKVHEVEGIGYIYGQSSHGVIHGYEVFRHKVNTMYDTVSFPGNEAFGSWAWNCPTYAKALNKLSTF